MLATSENIAETFTFGSCAGRGRRLITDRCFTRKSLDVSVGSIRGGAAGARPETKLPDHALLGFKERRDRSAMPLQRETFSGGETIRFSGNRDRFWCFNNLVLPG